MADKVDKLKKSVKLTQIKPIEYVTSGIKELDAITQIPRARVTEIYGKTGVGKTTLMTKCIAAMSEQDKVLYIDAENALNIDRIRQLGAKPENIDLSTLYILEEVAEFVIDSLGKYDVIIIDSVAALVPRAEDAGETGDAVVGLKARLMNQWMRKMLGRLGKTKTAVIFINQMRETMELYGLKQRPTGGLGLGYAASLRLELKTNAADKLPNGHWVNVEIAKSKVCAPYQKCRFKLEY